MAFCIRPWVHTCIKTDGQFELCCQSHLGTEYNIRTHSIEDFWHSEQVQQVRNQMLSGTWPTACNSCQQREKNGFVSLRNKSNKEFQIFEPYQEKLLKHYSYPKEQPIDIEAQLTNLCNLKCLMCNSQNSSSVLVENRELNIDFFTQSVYNTNEEQINKIKDWWTNNPARIRFVGGESLMVPEIKKLLNWAVNHGYHTQTEVMITTNLTKFDQSWAELLSKFSKIKLMISVDGTGAVNDYIRYGSRWAQIDSAVDLVNSYNIPSVLHTAIQNLNILNLPALIDWADKKDLFLDFEMLSWPDYLAIDNLPRPLLLKAQNQLLDYRTVTHTYNVNQIIDYIDECMNSNLDTQRWQKFVDTITLKDQHRNVSVLNVVPELREFWNA